MRNEILRSMTRDPRKQATATFRVGSARHLPSAPTARATSPRRGATCVRGSTGRLASPAQSGRACFMERRVEGVC